MDCKHEKIMSVNCALFCCDCGAELPADFLRNKHAPKAETPATPEKTAPKATRKTTKKGGK